MKVYKNIKDYLPVLNPVVTVGTFDGVHIGHRKIISRIKQLSEEINGETIVVTFEPHPQTILHPEENINILNTTNEKIQFLREIGIDNLIIISFTSEFASLSYTEFIKKYLIDKIKVKNLVIGYDHHFGNKRNGAMQHLAAYGEQYNFKVEEIIAQKFDDVVVSSTKIRKALKNGEIQTANYFLGYRYFISGQVVKGNMLGRSINFPTANIEVMDSRKLIPARGAYAVEVEIDDKKHYGMLNIGVRPTIGGTKEVIEVNIFDFNREIYSCFLKIIFVERLRDEVRYESLEQLGEQLHKDKDKALNILLNGYRNEFVF